MMKRQSSSDMKKVAPSSAKRQPLQAGAKLRPLPRPAPRAGFVQSDRGAAAEKGTKSDRQQAPVRKPYEWDKVEAFVQRESNSMSSHGPPPNSSSVQVHHLDPKTEPVTVEPVIAVEPPSAKDLEQVRLLTSQTWYHGYTPRTTVEALLVRQGDFCCRLNETHTFIISFMTTESLPMIDHMIVHYYSSTRKYSIVPDNTDASRFPKEYFDSVIALVTYYHSSSTSLGGDVKLRLVQPIARREWQWTEERVNVGSVVVVMDKAEMYMGTLATKEKLACLIKRPKALLNKTRITKLCNGSELQMKMSNLCPHIAAVLGVVVTIQPLMVVYESGHPLHLHLKENTDDVAQLSKWAQHIVKGLRYVHSQGLAHGSVAAHSCLLVEKQGKKGKKEAKLSNFGHAQLVPTAKRGDNTRTMGMPVESRMMKLAVADESMGAWMAPELYKRKERTQLGDIFSFGVTLMQLFNRGSVPMTADNRALTAKEFAQQYRMGNTPEAPKSMPDGLKPIYDGCLRLSPSSRMSVYEVAYKLNVVAEQ